MGPLGTSQAGQAYVGRSAAEDLARKPVTPLARPGSGNEAPPTGRGVAEEQELTRLRQQVAMLRQQQAAPQDEQLKKQLEIQQKEIETLEKQVKLLADQLKKAPPAGAAVEKLWADTATLQARSVQAARRD